MNNKNLPIDKWSYFKVFLLYFLLFGVWVLFPIFIPRFSQVSLIIGIVLVVAGVWGSMLVRRGKRRLGQILVSNAFYLAMFVTAARVWYVVIGSFWPSLLWISILVALYVLAWTLPTINSKLSTFLFKEQYNPQTQPGKVILDFSAKILPVAGSIGALIGMYGSRSGIPNLSLLILGIAFSFASIALAQLTSHQWWREDNRQSAITSETV